ncbi:transposase [Streptomyces sp. AcE210]|uniref:transposase n=1 Tax=Streptomyces sp. AcE210 TaxID=2292703 RepID=UPI001F0BDBC1|nr:transposase [Streptomyces sp. AcE210]
MNSITERWVQSCRHELLDHTLTRNETHLRRALHEYEQYYNSHRAHQAMEQAASLRALPKTDCRSPVQAGSPASTYVGTTVSAE